MKTEVILSALEAKHPGEKEYLQAVKEVLLPFSRLPGVDPILGPEMKSTGALGR